MLAPCCAASSVNLSASERRCQASLQGVAQAFFDGLGADGPVGANADSDFSRVLGDRLQARYGRGGSTLQRGGPGASGDNSANSLGSRQ